MKKFFEEFKEFAFSFGCCKLYLYGFRSVLPVKGDQQADFDRS